MSSGWPILWSGICDAAPTLNASKSTPIRSAVARVIRVSTKPGATALTLTLNGPSSIARVRAMPCSPALAVE